MIFAARLPQLFWKSCLLSTLVSIACSFPARCEELPAPSPQAAAAVTAAAVTADAVQEAFVRAAENIKPSVVTIYAERASRESDFHDEKKPSRKEETKPDNSTDKNTNQPFDIPPDDTDDERTSLGTGMVLNAQGQILTNYHVVKDAAFIHVLFNSDNKRPERLLASLVGFDEESDLAVLQLAPGTPRYSTIRPIQFADSDAVRVGEWAIAMGAPFDQTQTLTVGIISAKGRHLAKDNRLSLQDYLQTDAAINPGNSGGPLINLQGKVIGINTAILSPSRFSVGIGFAVPSNTIQHYLPTLTAGKTIERGFLGIQYVALDEEVAREFDVLGGMQIGALAKRGDQFMGPAKNAGLHEGDIITHVDGRAILSSDEFGRLIAGSIPGTVLQFTVVRPGSRTNETLTIQIKLAERSTLNTAATPNNLPVPLLPLKTSRLGMHLKNVEELNLIQRDKLGLQTDASGAVIIEINPGSPADIAELQRGFRLVRARATNDNWKDLPDKASFLRLEKSLKPGDRVLLQMRDKTEVSLYKLLIVPES